VTLPEIRNNIDQIDNQILKLLNQRMDWVKTVGEIKRETKTAIYRPDREKEIIQRLTALSEGFLNQAAIEAIFTEIFAVSRNLELPERVAFLGPEGSFTHQAAESRFGPLSDYLSLPTIRSVFESVDSGRARFGVIPIENSREGTVVESVDLLYEVNVNIAAELAIDVNFCFASMNDKIPQIKRIYTKDIAFRQCSKFLSDYFEGKNVEMIAVESTSKAAKMASEDANSAAICSIIGAKLFDLPVLFENIGDSINNRTRFFIIAKDFTNLKSDFGDKTTLIAELPNTEKAGVLATFLNDFKERNINLTKIQNRPYKDRNDFSFWFYVEFEGHQEEKIVQEILAKYSNCIKVLGSYVKMN
jgi:chorismate mutase / prephenate dehydratase